MPPLQTLPQKLSSPLPPRNVEYSQRRIDDQRLVGVVRAYLEADLAAALSTKPPSTALRRLVDHRPWLAQVAAGGVQDQVALGAQLQTLDAVES